LSEKKSSSTGFADPETLTAGLIRALEQKQKSFARLLSEPSRTVTSFLDPFNVRGSFAAGARKLLSNPAKLMKANLDFWKGHMELWQSSARRALGEDVPPTATADPNDRRFQSDEWDDQPVFDFLRQSYLITSRWLADTTASIEGLSEKDAHKLRFHTKQVSDALSPSNFILTNPEVIKATIDSKGQNLVRGMKNFARDIKAGGGVLKVALTDEKAFDLGVNIATTPGKIVYQNDLIQLIQYEPLTKKVYRRPLVIVPPWINKYYILDLQPENSFIRWAVSKGYTVFVASWVNPDESLSDKTMDDYLNEGILEALDAVEAATGEPEVTMIGYCVGGTLTGAALAYMAAKGDRRVKATTFFAAQMDFSEAGDLKVFIDEQQLESLDTRMAETGYLDGDKMSTAFNLLRANDLIWTVCVNNYLLGKDPKKFDLLYWNADATRMPRTLHMYYLRECYLRNNLAKPGGISLNDVPIDLGKVDIPIYLQASKEDHIAPYPSVFKAKNLFSGPVRFMLAGSGHIAGVINPPNARKYNYWMNESQPGDLEEWLAGAESHPGSWWDDWNKWLAPLSGEKVKARKPGDGKLKVLEGAPGSYAKIKS
jgi:polyhydroxyalkanoate synthase